MKSIKNRAKLNIHLKIKCNVSKKSLEAKNKKIKNLCRVPLRTTLGKE